MAFDGTDAHPSKKTGFTFRGREIILCKSRGHPKMGLVAKGMEKGIYPIEKMVEAATNYAVTGDLAQAAELAKVPLAVVRKWRKEEPFQAILREVWTENNEKLDALQTHVIEKSLEQVKDRIENGDFHVTPRGQVVRRPVSAKDLSLVHAINVDKRQLLRGLPTSRSESGDPAQKNLDRLERLAEKFENLARLGRQPKTVEVVDAEVVEVLPDAAAS